MTFTPYRVGQRLRVKVDVNCISAPGGEVPAGAFFDVVEIDRGASASSTSYEGPAAWKDGEGNIQTVATVKIAGSKLETVRGKPYAPGLDDRRKQVVGTKAQQAARGGRARTALSDGESVLIGLTCPECGVGTLVERHGRFGPFVSCDQYPRCTKVAKSSDHAAASEATRRKLALDDATTPTTPTAEPEPVTPTTTLPDRRSAATHVPPVFSPASSAPSQAPSQKPVRTPDVDDAGRKLGEALQNILLAAQSQVPVDEAKVREIAFAVAQERSEAMEAQLGARMIELAAKLQATQVYRGVEVKLADLQTVKIEGRVHQRFDAVLKTLAAGLRNVLLVGPAGCGKTTLAEQLALALGVEYAAQTLTAGASESVLVGRMVPDLTTGTEKYRTTRFVEVYRNGGLFLLDELDAADPNLLLVINTALANGHLTLPNGEVITRHERCYLLAAANTFGHGATRVYVGRAQLDAATLDRFVGSTFDLDYDRELEREIAGTKAPWLGRVWAAREKVNSLKLRRVVSTRMVISMARLTAAGMTDIDALRQAFTGWTPEELGQVGMAL